MSESWRWRVTAVTLAMAIGGCDSLATPVRSDPFEVRKLPAAIEPYARPAVDANTRFALDLYSELRTQPGNLFFSPFSTSIALAMTYAGAGGVTQTEMGEVLHLKGLERTHAALGALTESLARGSALGGYRLNIANGVWGQSGARIRDPYLAVMRDDYRAELAQVDFLHASEVARTTINNWVEERTERRIRDLFPSGSINERTRIALANAVYFKGKWASQFDPAKTRQGPFMISATETVEVPLMTQSGKFKLGMAGSRMILEMPYEGADLSMVVLLPPRPEDLGALEAELTLENLQQWLSGLHEQEMQVILPRFRMETDYMLTQPLERMGMRTAFTEGADFSNMTEEPGWFIQAVVHKAFVEVNEEGTEAAAATGVSMGVTSVPPSFVADHPFVFLIRDHVTGSILFIGRVIDPRG